MPKRRHNLEFVIGVIAFLAALYWLYSLVRVIIAFIMVLLYTT